jgi:hypothetical protein
MSLSSNLNQEKKEGVENIGSCDSIDFCHDFDEEEVTMTTDDEEEKGMENRGLRDELNAALDNGIVKEAMGFLNINTQDLYQEDTNINEDEDLYYHDGRITKTISDGNDDEDEEDLLFAAAQVALSLNRFLTSPQWSSIKSPSNIVSGADRKKPTAISTMMTVDGQAPQLKESANDWNSPQKSAIDHGGRENWILSSNYYEGDVSKSSANTESRSSKEEENLPGFFYMMGTGKETSAVPSNYATHSSFRSNLSIASSFATSAAVDDIVKQKPKIKVCILGAPELDFTKPEEMFFASAQPSPMNGDETSLFNGSSTKKKDKKNRMKLDSNRFFNNHARVLVSRHNVTEKYGAHFSPRGEASNGSASTSDIPQSTGSKETIENIISHVRPAPSQSSVTTAERRHTHDTNMDVRCFQLMKRFLVGPVAVHIPLDHGSLSSVAEVELQQ